MTRRELIAGIASAPVASAAFARGVAAVGAVTPEMFGAQGDGLTNDTDAFAMLSAHVNAQGGGTIVLRPVTYLVGRQHAVHGGKPLAPARLDARHVGPSPSFVPFDIIHLAYCADPIIIRGNGAKLRAAPGLRYGRFDPHSGAPLPDVQEKLIVTDKAAPYIAMVFIENCLGDVEISDLELDGDLQRLIVGGRTFRGGWEAGASGIRLMANTGSERLSRIYSHHHAVDGLILTRTSERTGPTTVTDAICEFNGRQACSVTGGSNFAFDRCKFRHTGEAGLRAKPGDGVDIEAESSPIRNVRFSHCEFSENAAPGVGAGSGDSAGISFDYCKFVGTKSWAAWPAKPQMRFSNCLFVGAIVHAYGDVDPARATQFVSCTFTNDQNLSPTREVYLGAARWKWLAVLQKATNVLFNRCQFKAVGNALLPLSERGVIYLDCTMSQASPTMSRPIGTYLGTNRINGNANLTGSILGGTVILNGKKIERPK